MPDLPDIIPPRLLYAEVIDSQHLAVFFNEKLDPVDASDPAHFSVDLGIGQPVLAEPMPGNSKTARLSFSKNFIDGATHVLTTTGLTDEIGNSSGPETTTFTFLKISSPELFDILINEFMADPSPSVGLPEVEWVELVNRSSKNIDLQQVAFSTGGSPVNLPSFILRPDSLVLLIPASADGSFSTVKNRLALPSLPSISNSADELSLVRAADGETIDLVPFDLSFYKNDQKNDGGWSIERTNPNRPCAAGGENWAACQSILGGTPGSANSNFLDEKDKTGAELIAVFPKSSALLCVQLSEGLDLNSVAATNFKIEPNLPISSVKAEQIGGPTLLLSLGQPMQPSQVYRLKISSSATDCSGNSFSSKNELPFALAEFPEVNDLIINELLFNPATGGADFVELFNRSKKAIDLAGLFVANISAAGAEVKKCTVERLVLPGEFAVLTTDTAFVRSNFWVKNPAWLHQNQLPKFEDDEGNIQIYRETGPTDVLIIDDFNYSKDFHHALLADYEKENRSLERLDPSGPTNDPANWQTAASPASLGSDKPGHGTPTATNSQSKSVQLVENEWVVLSNSRLSPDGDGYEDFVLIDLNLPKAGYTGHIEIFNEVGNHVKTVVGQQVSGVNPRFRWDGDTDDGTAVPVGIYIVQADFLHPDGPNKKKNLTLAVVKKWN